MRLAPEAFIWGAREGGGPRPRSCPILVCCSPSTLLYLSPKALLLHIEGRAWHAKEREPKESLLTHHQGAVGKLRPREGKELGNRPGRQIG